LAYAALNSVLCVEPSNQIVELLCLIVDQSHANRGILLLVGREPMRLQMQSNIRRLFRLPSFFRFCNEKSQL
jgi:hypothetical protein